MATQALFFRTRNLISNSISFLNIRGVHSNLLPPVRGLKQDTVEKLKQLKIPEKPKKPATPYMKFISEHRNVILKKNPDLKQTEVIKKCAEDWKTISNELKEKYNTAYKSECVIYDQKISSFNSNLTPEQREALRAADEEKKSDRKKRRIRKIQRETNKPKRPMGPYSHYIMDQSQIRNVSVRDLMSTLKDDWAKLPEKEKEQYKKKYLKEKEQYEAAMAEWEAKMMKEGRNDLVRVKSIDESKSSRITQLKKKSPQ